MNFNSKLIKLEHLPLRDELRARTGLDGYDHFLIIHDEVLMKAAFFREWIKAFNFVYSVPAGESLKTIDSFPEHISRIIEILRNTPPRKTCIVAVGGGSIGDFSGFVASIYKRGVPLVQIPSTWLAALDSAHGGKTALNVGGYKNQIGTFYPARGVVLVNELLTFLGRQQSRSALGELIKISIIDGKSMVREIKQAEEAPEKIIWGLLPKAIKAKLKIVKKDPFETKGERQKLNLGHTLGHALEAQFRLPHGFAVAQGIYFSAQWSFYSQLLSARSYSLIKDTLDRFFREQKLPDGQVIGNFRSEELHKLLSVDKKLVGESRLDFIFIQDVGKTKVVTVAFNKLIREAARQGWVV